MKYARRRELQAQFAAFAATNRVIQVHQRSLDEFWQTTSDTWHYFSSGNVHLLRQALYDNAERLMTISGELTACRTDDPRYAELNESRKEILEWFGDTIEHMDPIFHPEIKQHPNFKDVGRECLRIAGRVLRA